MKLNQSPIGFSIVSLLFVALACPIDLTHGQQTPQAVYERAYPQIIQQTKAAYQQRQGMQTSAIERISRSYLPRLTEAAKSVGIDLNTLGRQMKDELQRASKVADPSVRRQQQLSVTAKYQPILERILKTAHIDPQQVRQEMISAIGVSRAAKVVPGTGMNFSVSEAQSLHKENQKRSALDPQIPDVIRAQYEMPGGRPISSQLSTFVASLQPASWRPANPASGFQSGLVRDDRLVPPFLLLGFTIVPIPTPASITRWLPNLKAGPAVVVSLQMPTRPSRDTLPIFMSLAHT